MRQQATCNVTTAYIARCRTCGDLVMAQADDPALSEAVAMTVGEAVREGYTIERVTAEWVRENWRGCTCERTYPTRQLELAW